MKKQLFKAYCIGAFISLLFFGSCNTSNGNPPPPPLIIEPEEEMPPITGTPLIWGVDDAGGYQNVDPLNDASKRIFKEFGFDLFVHHYRQLPSYAANGVLLQNLHDFYSDLGVHLILNLEAANWSSRFIDEKGVDWFNRSDGRHYYQFPNEMLQIISGLKNKPGLMYDEPEHMQNRRNAATIPNFEAPFMLSETQAVSLEKAADNFTAEARKIAQVHEPYGLKLYTEHVFPIQYHTYARAGFIPVSKILKENMSPAYIATAIGAAIQYDTPFWLTPDLWHLGTYPGHSVDTYRSSLLLAYHMGADAIYTENLSHDQDKKGSGSLVLMNEKKDNYRVTEHGKAALWFRKTYAPENPRHYTFKQLKPKVVIIRQEDASWGQTGNLGFNQLFGVPEWKNNAVTQEWIHIWHLLSNQEMSKNAISWHNSEVKKQFPNYRLLFPLDGVVVFDHHVRMPHIKDAGLIFLTGVGVSEETLADVRQRVKEGAICATLPHLAPSEVTDRTGNNGAMNDGQGKWIVAESFLNLIGIQDLKPFLPKGNYMTYQFGDKEVKFAPVGGDNNKITVTVNQVLN